MVGPDAVEHDVLLRVHVELLREIGVDLQEFDAVAAGDAGGLGALRLERGEERLEPLEGARVLAHPDELDAAQAGRRVRAVAQVPDVLQDRGPRGDADTRADEDGDLVLEYVLRRGTIRSIDSQGRHLLPVLQRHLVHTHGINALVQLGLGGASTDGVAQSSSEVANLSDVDRDVRVVRARGDGKRMPLIAGERRHLQEKPLASLVFERRLLELDFHHI